MIRRIAFAWLLAVFCSAYASAMGFSAAVSSPECSHWVDSVMGAMSPRERIAQLFVPVVDPTKGENSRALVKRYVADNGVGGLLFRKGSITEYANLINYAQSLARVPVMMTFDGEWGLAMRIADTPQFPYNMALGAITDRALLEEYGAEVARECRELGIHVDFAPVADVNLNPANPVIGRRSFGEDPVRVADAVVAFGQGMERAGVISCAKHFPGHGDTSTDSHKTIPVVDHSRDFLFDNDLLPFRRYFDAGLSSVMVGHLSVPAIDSSMNPASMSHPISSRLLKDELGFKGLVFTDALEMKGASREGNNCVSAFLAGADLLLSSTNPPSDITAIEQAVKSGKISQTDIDTRCHKILSYKWALGLSSRPENINLNGLKSRLNAPEAADLIDRLTIASITVTGNRTGLLPLAPGPSVAVVNLGAPADNDFSAIVRRHVPATTFSDSDGSLPESRLNRISDNDIVIVGVYKDDAATAARLARIKARRAVIPVMFMNPYKAMRFRSSLADAEAMVMAYDNTASSRRAAADALFGGNAVSGRLPVSMPGVAELGEGVSYPASRLSFSRPAHGIAPWLGDSIDAIMLSAISAGAFPGAQVLVVKDGCVAIDRCYGKTSNTPSAKKVTDATIYDLASLSKAVGTLPGLMLAKQKGLIDLDAPIAYYIPDLVGTDKAALTPRHLLFHESGMPASLDMYTLMMEPDSYTGALIKRKRVTPNTIKIGRNAYGNSMARMRHDITAKTRPDTDAHEIARGLWATHASYDTIMHRIYDTPLRTPGFRYSCLNFCLLMDIEQRVTGIPHSRWVCENIFMPIGAFSACYRPTELFAVDQIASTETDNFLRKQTLTGYVHDELAAFSGGVQGNAGLFASATDVAKYAQMLLNSGCYGGAQVLDSAVVNEFTTTVSPTCHRGLGFDKPRLDNPDKSATCEEAPASTYGHVGFTGTCCWIDPTNNLIYIFLSNRVNPSRDNPAWFKQKARTRVQSAIYKAL